MVLKFKNAIFKDGENITVRRGIKWAIVSVAELIPVESTSGEHVGTAEIQDVAVLRFSDLDSARIKNEHDPRCRTYAGLYLSMRDTYPGFTQNEIVTVLTFTIHSAS